MPEQRELFLSGYGPYAIRFIHQPIVASSASRFCSHELHLKLLALFVTLADHHPANLSETGSKPSIVERFGTSVLLSSSAPASGKSISQSHRALRAEIHHLSISSGVPPNPARLRRCAA